MIVEPAPSYRYGTFDRINCTPDFIPNLYANEVFAGLQVAHRDIDYGRVAPGRQTSRLFTLKGHVTVIAVIITTEAEDGANETLASRREAAHLLADAYILPRVGVDFKEKLEAAILCSNAPTDKRRDGIVFSAVIFKQDDVTDRRITIEIAHDNRPVPHVFLARCAIPQTNFKDVAPRRKVERVGRLVVQLLRARAREEIRRCPLLPDARLRQTTAPVAIIGAVSTRRHLVLGDKSICRTEERKTVVRHAHVHIHACVAGGSLAPNRYRIHQKLTLILRLRRKRRQQNQHHDEQRESHE